LALPVSHQSRSKQIISIALYNIGRILTYAVLGLLFGMAGRKLYLSGLQQWFSIGAGILMLLLAFQYFIRKKNIQPKWMNGFNVFVQQLMEKSMRSRNPYAVLFLGMANGLLPCGMVYLAIAGALNTTEVWHSVLFMAGFGAGTFPAMFALTLFGFNIDLSIRRKIKNAMPYVVAGMAILLILRGMNLGIPFVSPVMAEGLNATSVECH
jgi:uncharacterized protein